MRHWNAPLCITLGLVLLAVQVYVFLEAGLLSSWLIGGGVSLILVGALVWFYSLDNGPSDPEFPVADQYEKDFHHEPNEVDPNRL